MPRAARKSWSAQVGEAFAFHDRVLSEVAAPAAERGARVAFAGDAALMWNGLDRFVTTRAVAILSHPALQRPPPGVLVHDVTQGSDVRLCWSALVRAGKIPDFPILVVRKEHIVAFALVEHDWEAFDCILGVMAPFRRRTVRRVIFRDIGPHAARLFDDPVEWSDRGGRPSEVRH